MVTDLCPTAVSSFNGSTLPGNNLCDQRIIADVSNFMSNHGHFFGTFCSKFECIRLEKFCYESKAETPTWVNFQKLKDMSMPQQHKKGFQINLFLIFPIKYDPIFKRYLKIFSVFQDFFPVFWVFLHFFFFVQFSFPS